MNVKDLQGKWLGWYRGAPPIGHLLRAAHADRWVRIHSLPDSKRYAESADEWCELLDRHNAVATAQLGEGNDCVLFTRFSPPIGSSESALLTAPQLVGILDESWPGADALDDEPEPPCLFAGPVLWRSGAHDTLLRAVATEATGAIVIVNLATGRVYAPYDGGADLFFPSELEERIGREVFREWLSPFPGGL